jgi:hypothetical protein
MADGSAPQDGPTDGARNIYRPYGRRRTFGPKNCDAKRVPTFRPERRARIVDDYPGFALGRQHHRRCSHVGVVTNAARTLTHAALPCVVSAGTQPSSTRRSSNNRSRRDVHDAQPVDELNRPTVTSRSGRLASLTSPARPACQPDRSPAGRLHPALQGTRQFPSGSCLRTRGSTPPFAS